MKVQGPNGLVVDIPASVATGLVGGGGRGYRFVPETETKPVTEETSEAPKPRRTRKTKTDSDDA